VSERKNKVVEKLESTRAAFLEMAEGIEAAAWSRPVFSESTEWQVSDLFRHVVSAEHSMTRLIENIRDGGEGASADFDLTRWNASRVQKAREKSIGDLTADLTKNRSYLLGVIDTLTNEDLDKSGRHGSLRIMTIEEILNLIADHEQHHLEDIQKATA
jgi:uncharacterized damage-inducible protein DinB